MKEILKTVQKMFNSHKSKAYEDHMKKISKALNSQLDLINFLKNEIRSYGTHPQDPDCKHLVFSWDQDRSYFLFKKDGSVEYRFSSTSWPGFKEAQIKMPKGSEEYQKLKQLQEKIEKILQTPEDKIEPPEKDSVITQLFYAVRRFVHDVHKINQVSKNSHHKKMALIYAMQNFLTAWKDWSEKFDKQKLEKTLKKYGINALIYDDGELYVPLGICKEDIETVAFIRQGRSQIEYEYVGDPISAGQLNEEDLKKENLQLVETIAMLIYYTFKPVITISAVSSYLEHTSNESKSKKNHTLTN